MIVPLSIQKYKWVPANLMLRVTLPDGLASHPEGVGWWGGGGERVKVPPVVSCYRLRADGPLGLDSDFTYLYLNSSFLLLLLLIKPQQGLDDNS